MAVTGVNEYTNTYAASNSANTKGSSELNRSTQDYLNELKQKYPDVNITVADFANDKQMKSYMLGSTGYNNIAISSNIIAKMASDPTVAAKYEKVIADTPTSGERIKERCEANGSKVYACGTMIDKDGKVTYWAVGGETEAHENPGTVYKEKMQKQLEEKRAKKKEEEKLKEKRLEQAETAEQLLEKLKADSQAETAEGIAVTATKIPEEGKGTQVDYTI